MVDCDEIEELENRREELFRQLEKKKYGERIVRISLLSTVLVIWGLLGSE